MAQRRIGQEKLWGERTARSEASLDDVAVLVDWAELDQLLAGISASSKGEPGWSPLALFRALLLATWHDLSDVKLADALGDRANFRRFCGFSTHEATPVVSALNSMHLELKDWTRAANMVAELPDPEDDFEERAKQKSLWHQFHAASGALRGRVQQVCTSFDLLTGDPFARRELELFVQSGQNRPHTMLGKEMDSHQGPLPALFAYAAFSAENTPRDPDRRMSTEFQNVLRDETEKEARSRKRKDYEPFFYPLRSEAAFVAAGLAHLDVAEETDVIQSGVDENEEDRPGQGNRAPSAILRCVPARRDHPNPERGTDTGLHSSYK